MAKYLRPRRGAFLNALINNPVLKKGEMFLCMVDSEDIGKGPGAMYIGDGASSFSQYKHNGSTVANTAQPLLIHPMVYRPIFANTNPASSGWTINAGTTEINAIGNGSGSSVSLPTVIGNIKGALCKHADSINKINADFATKQYVDDNVTAAIAQVLSNSY